MPGFMVWNSVSELWFWFWFSVLVLVGSGGSTLGRQQLLCATDRVDLRWVDADSAFLARNRLKPHNAIDLGVDRVVLADADVVADPELGAALTNDDCAGVDVLTVVSLDTEPFGLAVATIPRTTNAFLVSHDEISSGHPSGGNLAGDIGDSQM